MGTMIPTKNMERPIARPIWNSLPPNNSLMSFGKKNVTNNAEKAVFAKIAARKSLREKLSVKIMQIQKEKGQMLMIREKKAHSMKKLRIDREWREAFHSFNNAQGV